jgi:hypothetical protein
MYLLFSLLVFIVSLIVPITGRLFLQAQYVTLVTLIFIVYKTILLFHDGVYFTSGELSLRATKAVGTSVIQMRTN